MKRQGRLNHYGPLATCGAIITQGDKILLLKRNNEPFRGYWGLVGGKMNRFERAVGCIRREIKEEIGVKATKVEFLFYFDHIDKKRNTNALEIWFKAKIVGKFKLLPKEVSECKYLPISKAKKLKLAYTHNQVLNQYLKLCQSKINQESPSSA